MSIVNVSDDTRVIDCDAAVCKSCGDKYSQFSDEADHEHGFCGLCLIACDEDGCEQKLHIDDVDFSYFCGECGALLCNDCLISHGCV